MCFRSLSIVLLTLVFIVQAKAQPERPSPEDRPKLVVGIVVDQMRYEYISRFWSRYGDDGFKRLVNDGFSFTNHHYNYFPTYTGPGHAAIYTGTTPSVNGIVGNSWYERKGKSGMYVVSDTTMQTLGGDAAPRSPANLQSTTITDELKQGISKSKVISVSIKDRGAVLPAGHLGDGAFWYDDKTGHFVSSTWYMDVLPEWLQQFNQKGLAQTYSDKTWQPLLPIQQYTESNADDSAYEQPFPWEEKAVFPHEFGRDTTESYWTVKGSPYGNTLIVDVAKAGIAAENLGADAVTDFLAVSFSSTDYVGHQFGPNSVEIQDTYLRLDKDIADLLNYLDKEVGEGNYLVFLTSDHGVVDTPVSLTDKGLPGGMFDSEQAIDSLQVFLNTTFGEADWIETYANQQVYLNRDVIEEQEISLEIMQHEAARFLRRFDGVALTNTAYNFETEGYGEGLQAMYQRGHYPLRSGDVYIQLAPGWLDRSSEVGTSHGSPYSYDTHVPLIFYGWNIPQGRSSRKTVIPQIAPTISNMLQIEFPSGSSNDVLRFE